MGNCSLKAVSDAENQVDFIRIMTDSGDILELKGPKLVREVLENFPGYKIFRQNQISSPLFDHQQLVDGQFYYLLPIRDEKMNPSNGRVEDFEAVTRLGNRRKGVWRVKLVINSDKLEDILSEEVNTEAFIEHMRIAAATPGRTKKMPGRWC
ncbi:unnamed protein product [Fraxinus pennsylvanica]|uniref:Uncharacterized protein n=1 Tax=Fraxinus pennsylvanica TaxID=56036 RepID=A0AAD1ZRA8_9LAMI|nr:unnamed protein product [Fraxinus pennsylvanica]